MVPVARRPFTPYRPRPRLPIMTPARPTPRGAATRERLLGAALSLFASRGFHGTTTAQLAAATALAEGTIYRHFTGKDSLYNAVMLRVWTRGEELVANPADAGLTPRDRLRAAALRLIGEARESPASARLLLGPVESAVLDAVARAAADRFRDAVIRLVALGKQHGTVRPGTAELWTAVWLAIVGLAVERVASGAWSPEHPNVLLAIGAAESAIEKLPAA